MIAEISFEYGKAFSPAEQAELQKLADHPLQWEDAKDPKRPNHKKLDWLERNLVLHIEDAARFGKFEVNRIITQGILGTLGAIVDQLRELNRTHQIAFNERVQVAVPDSGLLNIKELRIETNCCTDAANGLLQEGWKIVAICPQPDQRRPDYVFGK
jgi:hypothetical protein